MIIVIRLVLLLTIPSFHMSCARAKADEFVLYSISQSGDLLHLITLIQQIMFNCYK